MLNKDETTQPSPTDGLTITLHKSRLTKIHKGEVRSTTTRRAQYRKTAFQYAPTQFALMDEHGEQSRVGENGRGMEERRDSGVPCIGKFTDQGYEAALKRDNMSCAILRTQTTASLRNTTSLLPHATLAGSQVAQRVSRCAMMMQTTQHDECRSK